MPDAHGLGVPKVSVCVPTYNRAPLLRPFLDSIFRQTFTDFEVVVSDNCSTDATPGILASEPDSRLRWHRNDTNIGPFRNMNRLLQLARGEYVCVVHDDDLYAPTFLEKLSGMLDRHPAVGMVHAAAYEVDQEGIRRGVTRAYATTRVLHGDQEFLRYLQGHNVCCSSVMARRSLYEQAGGFDTELLCADFLMWVKFALHGDIAYVAEPLLDMRVHADTVSGWLNPDRWYREFMIVLERGLALGAAVKPTLVADRPRLLRAAARAQGRRFLVAALAAVSRGDYALAQGYRDVLVKLRTIGLSPLYPGAAAALTNPVGRRLLSLGAYVRRARARRHSQRAHKIAA